MGHGSARRRVAAAALVGLLLTIGVAWGLALTIRRGGGALRYEIVERGSKPWRVVAERKRIGYCRRCEMLASPKGYGVAGSAVIVDMWFMESGSITELGPRQTLADANPILAAQVAAGAVPGPIAVWPLQDRAGWPWHALALWHDGVIGFGDSAVAGTSRPRRTAYGMELQRRSGPLALDGLALPLWPLWAGFAADWAFWGAWAWAGMFGAGKCRDRRRRRAGKCVRCGYALEGLASCPECGAGR